MKYIKLYEDIDYIKDNIRQDIRDILLEINDIGYTTEIFDSNYYAYVKILKLDNDFGFRHIQFYDNIKYYNIKYEEIKDCVLRLKDYLGNRYVSSSIFIKERSVGKWYGIKLSENFKPEESDNITALIIDYKIEALK